jgi:hypothetical protein
MKTLRIILIFTLVAGVSAQIIKRRFSTIPIPAVAKICGNEVIPNESIQSYIPIVQSQGCGEVRIIATDPYNSLVYGVRVLMGESNIAAEGGE